MTIEEIKKQISENEAAGVQSFTGLTSSDIGKYSRMNMFGENYEAFPSQAEWSRITD